MGCSRRTGGLVVALLVSALSASAQDGLPGAPPDPVSEAVFARELIPVLLGRRPRGVAEVALVAQVSALLGREAAARTLMQQPEYLDHWSEVMIDLLEVQRGGLPASEACFAAPLRSQDDGGALAAFVHDNPPTAAPGGPPFNMADLIRSAIQLDDLSPVYQAYLVPISARRYASDTETSRAYVADQFLRVYLSREIGCLGCHNRTFSLSNKQDASGQIVWQRLWAVPANFEKAVFGNFTDSVGTRERLDLLFRADVRTSLANPNGFVPWGFDASCTSEYPNFSSATGAFRTPPSDRPTAHFGSIDGATNPRASVIDLEEAFRNGVNELALHGLVLSQPPPTTVTTPEQAAYCGMLELTADTCSACHAGAAPAGGLDLSVDPAAATVGVAGVTGYTQGQTLVVPDDPGASALYGLVASGTMPPGTILSAGDIGLVESWIAAGAPSGEPELCTTSHVPDVAPDPAFAYLVAEGVVDRIWQQVMGSRLTIDHGFPRNAAQLQTLWTLTEDVFLPGRWSLADVLVAIVTSDGFVRSAPADGGPGPYPLPMLWDPWIEADPTLPPPLDPDHATLHNGPGELARMHDTVGVVRGAIAALDWARPIRFPGATTPWPRRLEPEMGRYESVFSTGFFDVDFQTLLHWESEIGTCPGRPAGEADWITRLVGAIDTHDAQHPAAPLTLREAYLVLKDWLLQDPTLGPAPGTGVSEEQALLALLNAELPADGQVSLDASKTAVGDLFLETKLREACGVLLKSPAFLLGHIAPASYTGGLPPAPRLRVCNHEPCQAEALCESVRGSLATLGQTVHCEPGGVLALGPPPSLQPAPSPAPADPDLAARAKRLAALCPSGLCAFLPWRDVARCDDNPALCRKPPIPDCDPRIASKLRCGALPVDPATPGLLSVWGEGAVVDHAVSVSLARPGAKSWAALRPGTKLVAGDVLRVPGSAELLARDRQGSFGTPPTGSALRLTPAKPVASRTFSTFAVQQRNARVEMPFFLRITGPSASGVQTRGPGRLDSRALRAGVDRRALQPRTPAARDRARIALRAARPSVRAGAHRPTDASYVHLLSPPGMSAPETPAPAPTPTVAVRFAGRGVQSLFCPGQPALRCTPDCRVALDDGPRVCGVLGTERGRKQSGELRLSRPGVVQCQWRDGRLGCR